MTEIRQKIHRLDRVSEVRQIAVDTAEARILEARKYRAHLDQKLAVEEGNIRQAQEEFAHPDPKTAVHLRQAETMEKAARFRAQKIRKDIEKAKALLEERQIEWRVAMREKKTVEKLRERQLQKAVREEGALMQKVMDEASLVKYVQSART